MDMSNYKWRCKCCGSEMSGLPMALAYNEPANWQPLDDETKKRSRLDSDICTIRHANGAIDHFIRCVLPIPVPEIEGEFHFGVWMSISEDSLRIYVDGSAAGTYEKEGCFGYLMHNIPGFGETWLMHADVRYQKDGFRPNVILHKVEHPLVEKQQHGITLAEIEALVAQTSMH